MTKPIYAFSAAAFILVMLVAAADATLEIFGNANLDNVINESDAIYVQGIINGTNKATELADANHDGKVDKNDIDQIEQIINDTQKELIILNGQREPITFSGPIKRIVLVPHNHYLYETMRAIGAGGNVVAITDAFVNSSNKWDSSSRYYPELTKIESIGTIDEPNTEKILSLKADAIFTDRHSPSLDKSTDLFGIPIIDMDVNLTNFEESTRTYGYILNKREKAEEYIAWWKNWEHKIDERLNQISEDKKPLVLATFYNSPGITSFYLVGKTNMRADVIRKAGARNLGDYAGINNSGSNVDPEWILKQNPPYILLITGNRYMGYDTSNSSIISDLRNEFMNRSEISGLNAVKNGNVYMASGLISIGGANGLLGAVYHAKQFHPELFADLDPKVMHQEYLDKFQGIDFDVSKEGLFVYPPI
jgi:iron complex transport system substrate-binding protein